MNLGTRTKRWWFVCRPDSHMPMHVGGFRTKKEATEFKNSWPSLADHNVVIGLLYVPRKRKKS